MLVVVAAVVIAMARSSVSLEAPPTLTSSPLALFPLAHSVPPSPPPRRRSHAAASLRHARALVLGYYKPKPPSKEIAYIEVPKSLHYQIKDIVKGKVLKTNRETQIGHPTHSTRLAALAAHKANITSKEEFQKDTKIVRRQNAANHGSPKGRTRWADISDESEQFVTIHNLTGIINQTFERWLTNIPKSIAQIPEVPLTSPPPSSPPSPPFSFRSNSISTPSEHADSTSPTHDVNLLPGLPNPLPLPLEFGKQQNTYEAVFDQIFSIKGRDNIHKYFQEFVNDAEAHHENYQPTREEFETANLSYDERNNEEFMRAYRRDSTFPDDPPNKEDIPHPNAKPKAPLPPSSPPPATLLQKNPRPEAADEEKPEEKTKEEKDEARRAKEEKKTDKEKKKK
jgi:hypothetical protein